MPNDFLSLLDQRVVIFDGAMGTSIHCHEPTDADWGGKDLVNCTDWMVMTRPDMVRSIHCDFLAVGCDAVETNTFGANRVALGEFGLQDHTVEVNRRAAQIAREAVAQFTKPDWKRFVVGSMGPGTKSVTLGAVSFDEVVHSYKEQARGLIEGGADVLLVETCFDILQSKAALVSCIEMMQELGKKLPLMAQVTIEFPMGTMLLGTEIGAALTTLETYPVDVIGMNCATGPQEMIEHVRYLSQHCTRKLSCLPNAGIPENVGGQAHFHLTPDALASHLSQFVKEFGFNIVGGCCGTTPDHLAAVVKALRGVKPRARNVTFEPSVSSLFNTASLRQEPRPMLVGERTNTNGSRKFKQLLEAGDWEGMVGMAREQEREGAHVLDVCTAYVGRDEVKDMHELIRRYNQAVTIPLMIDSTEWQVLEDALKLISGKAIINSINLEEGRKKIDRVVPMAKRYGAALVALTIDEEGQATTSDWKFRVAKRIYDICTEEFGIPPTDLLFDPLVFPITTGDETLRRAGLETLNAIRRIKAELPGAGTHLGLSNVSFGLNPYTRQVLNSMYMHYALEAGLDSAIVHAAKIMPLNQIDEKARELCRRLIFDDRSDGDPLQELIAHFDKEGTKGKGEKGKKHSLGETVEERLKQAIIQGRRDSLIADLDAARQYTPPLEIINKVLLDGMRVVGELFGSGQMQLPFVLQSAEVMKASVAHLQQFMEKIEGTEKGKIVLATVKGDVHDIGKNLVDIILTNNGYKVYNLGIKQPIENILHAAVEHHANAIGLSGLLVKSTVVMKEDLQTLRERGVTLPVICGGAALNRRYVEQDLRAAYGGHVFYGEDAFTGLHIMDELCSNPVPVPVPVLLPVHAPKVKEKGTRAEKKTAAANGFRSKVSRQLDIPQPPFLGSRIITDIDMRDVFRFLNERTLISTQWQFRKNNVPPKEYERQMREVAMPALDRIKRLCLEENILQPAVAYGFFPCAASGDDLVIFEDDGRTERLRFLFPRQETGDHLCLSDYFAPGDAQATDYVAFMAVTMGPEVSRRAKEYFESARYTDYLYLHGLGVESAEALAEYWHKSIRAEWGFGHEDADDVRKLFKLHYRGCRYSFGYPACPNLEDQVKMFELLRPERIGLALSEQFQLEPEQSTTALIAHHPEAKYFNVGSCVTNA